MLLQLLAVAGAAHGDAVVGGGGATSSPAWSGPKVEITDRADGSFGRALTVNGAEVDPFWLELDFSGSQAPSWVGERRVFLVCSCDSVALTGTL